LHGVLHEQGVLIPLPTAHELCVQYGAKKMNMNLIVSNPVRKLHFGLFGDKGDTCPSQLL
jgi:hypothetical protein